MALHTRTSAAHHQSISAAVQKFACKLIAKQLDLPNLGDARQARHSANIAREVAVLRRLRGSLSVIQLEAVFEDVHEVALVTELCTGGELWRPRGRQEYSEATVAAYMRAVLRTLAQCHAAGILHRDVKPGNFMLLAPTPESPVKAIDFGMAVFFEEADLPLTDLGLDGTAWFMAPEMLSSEAYPASDVWAAGVMAYQLLSGFLPFDDHRNPKQPALSLVWKSILTDPLRFSHRHWNDISDSAKDFVKLLLAREWQERSTARQALEHPWLAAGTTDPAAAAPLASGIVARMQQYARRDALQRTILPLIANELLQRLQRDYSGDSVTADGLDRAVRKSSGSDQLAQADSQDTPPRNARTSLDRASSVASSMDPEGSGSRHNRRGVSGSGSVPALLERLRSRATSSPGLSAMAENGASGNRLLRNCSDVFLATTAMHEGSVHGRTRMRRDLSSSSVRAMEQVKAARLALDTSASGSRAVNRPQCQEASRRGASLRRTLSNWAPGSMEAGTQAVESPEGAARLRLPSGDGSSGGTPGAQQCGSEVQRRGGSLALRQLSIVQETDNEAASPRRPSSGHSPGLPSISELHSGHEQDAAPTEAAVAQPQGMPVTGRRVVPAAAGNDAAAPDSLQRTIGHSDPSEGMQAKLDKVALTDPGGNPFSSPPPHNNAMSPTADPADATPPPQRGSEDGAGANRPPSPHASVRSGVSVRCMQAASQQNAGLLAFLSRFVDSDAKLEEMRALLRALRLLQADAVGAADFRHALRDLGFELSDTEADAVLRYISEYEEVSRPAFVASQLDWRRLQENHTAMWLECARATFTALGPGPDGAVAVDQLLGLLKSKLRDDDVDLAVEEAMMAHYAESCGVTFDDFVSLLQADGSGAGGGAPPAALYDTRYVGSPRAGDAAAKTADFARQDTL